LAALLDLFVTGSKGFETQLFHEIRSIVTEGQVHKRYGGIQVQGSLEQAYRVCLWSRLANRVFLSLTQFKCDSEQALYEQTRLLNWGQHLDPSRTLAVSASVSSSNLSHSQYVALKIKDAIVDQFRANTGLRPSVDKDQPDVAIHCLIHKNKATLSLDLSGESLHRRGYRLQHSGAPLKEHLAAALLAHSGWPERQDNLLIDPLCGSGTFVIEAALWACQRAPGLKRRYFGFLGWRQHDEALWQALLEEARDRVIEPQTFVAQGFDVDARSIHIANENAQRAGVAKWVAFAPRALAQFAYEGERPFELIGNAPYGERIEAQEGLPALYQTFGRILDRFPTTRLHLLSGNQGFMHRLRRVESVSKPVRNGPIDCTWYGFEPSESAGQAETPPALDAIPEQAVVPELFNRLRKNQKNLQRWAKKNDIFCYRLYDADLPDYAFALDRYAHAAQPERVWYYLQEYKAPKSIDPKVAEERLDRAGLTVQKAFVVPERDLAVTQRQRQSGSSQYRKRDDRRATRVVSESGVELVINTADYLDTGLFLDHRPLRRRVLSESRGKRVLNLFCYTGSFSVMAAQGGAESVLSVDLSKTYLDWADENLSLNGFENRQQYALLQADILQWVQRPGREAKAGFDIVVLDPPSFSNSSRMHDELDLQRDHARLIEPVMRMLRADGVLYFSTNKRKFKLDAALQQQFEVSDISPDTLDPDFKRRPDIHRCWRVQNKARAKLFLKKNSH